MHLVSWDEVCKPKEVGGLGLRKTRDMNLASIGKLGWRLFHDRTSLWARVLIAKYRLGSNMSLLECSRSRPGSHIWRGILWGVHEVLLKGIRWRLGDGSKIRFWLDPWLLNMPLISAATMAVNDHDLSCLVRDYWSETGWDWPRFAAVLPTSTVLQLASVAISSEWGVSDVLSWGPSNDGLYSVSSAYNMLVTAQSGDPSPNKPWNTIWKLRVPERIRTFLWLSLHGRILTNAERVRRHLTVSATCACCGDGEENLAHLFRDCGAMRAIWDDLVPVRYSDCFFSTPFLDWFNLNLSCTQIFCHNIPWGIIFAISLWWIWKWRNARVFGDTRVVPDKVGFIINKAKEVYTVMCKTNNDRLASHREEKLIQWKRPARGWAKLNCDGSVKHDSGLASAGGVIRDDDGRWVAGFTHNIGSCTVPMAEL